MRVYTETKMERLSGELSIDRVETYLNTLLPLPGYDWRYISHSKFLAPCVLRESEFPFHIIYSRPKVDALIAKNKRKTDAELIDAVIPGEVPKYTTRQWLQDLGGSPEVARKMQKIAKAMGSARETRLGRIYGWFAKHGAFTEDDIKKLLPWNKFLKLKNVGKKSKLLLMAEFGIENKDHCPHCGKYICASRAAHLEPVKNKIAPQK